MTIFVYGLPSSDNTMQAYRVADCLLLADGELEALAPFAAAGMDVDAPAHVGPVSLPSKSAGIVRNVNGWIAGQHREVACWLDGGDYHLRVAGAGEFAISAAGDRIACLSAEATSALPQELADVILGPALNIALALQGTFSLHASAMRADGQALAFVGASGAGKSTLARHLGSTKNGRWQRIADDVLPIRPGADGAAGLPHYPQLKLAQEAQVGADVAQELPLRAVYVVARAGQGDAVHAELLGQRDAATVLIRHTLATSLFADELLVAHLEFCARVASSLPVYRLNYPHTPYALRQVSALLADS